MLKINYILSLAVVIIFSSITFGQFTEPIKETRLIDEFGRVGDCDRGARLDAMMIEIQNNPGSKGYILIYRGTKDILPNQSDGFLKKLQGVLRNHLLLRNYDMNRIKIIDAGFRDQDSFVNRIWLVPKNGQIPKPTDVVPRPKIPTDRAYLADKSYGYFDEASFESLQNKVTEDTDLIDYEYTVDDFETEEINAERELSVEEKEIIEREKYFVSDSFIKELEKNKTSKGIIFYYADAEEYHLGNVQEILNNNLNEFSKKYKVDISRIQIVYGGYRKYPGQEFWVVPKNAPDAIATPEEKKIKDK